MGDRGRAKRKSYHSIASELISRINSGAIAEGAFLPKERDLMAEFGVTRTTVRRALGEVVSEGYGRSIPNKGVVPIRKGQPESKVIAMVDGSSLVLRALYSKMNAEFLRLGYHLIHIDSEVIGLENSLLFAMERGYDGAFVWSFEGYPDVELVKRAQERMPIIALDHRLRNIETDLVTLDYFGMAIEACEYLVNCGRKRIAVSGMLDMLDITHERFSGYMRALFTNGHKPDVRDYCFCHTSGYPKSNYDHLISRLRAPDRPDALFVMQDEFVPGAVEAILECGLSIPDDVAIATIGDDVVVTVGGQNIAAVHCDWDGFADSAMDLMLRRIAVRDGNHRRIVAGHQFVPAGPSNGISARPLSGFRNASTLVVTRRNGRSKTDMAVKK